MITNAKVNVEKFDCRNNFDIWESDMKDALYILDFDQVLKVKKPVDICKTPNYTLVVL